jgi:hypothetical protein
MNAREYRPDVLIIGAPKAGTSALHTALAKHSQIYASPIKEPKYYMCWDAPPPSYFGPRRCAQQSGMDLAPSGVRGANLARSGGCPTAGEHTVLSLSARCSTQDR